MQFSTGREKLFLINFVQTRKREKQNIEHLATDLENAIWRKHGGSSTPSPFSCSVKELETSDVRLGALREAVLGRTVWYIATAVVVQEGRVLMMREAKRSCRGAWYLPTGRVERNESLEEGVIREMLEETGLQFKPVSIICIDSQGTSWFRFTFVGYITGGKLKTLKEQDEESMEAGWFTPKEVFTSLVLRAEDIGPLIDAGIKWYENKQEKPICRLMPVKKPHKHSILRLVVIKRLEKNDKKSLHCILLKSKRPNNPCPCFPYKVINSSEGANVTSVIDKSMRGIDSGIAYKTHGYLNVEHTGKPHGEADGLCLTVLVEIFIPIEDGILHDKYQWFEVEETGLRDKIWDLVDIKGCAEPVQF